MRREVAVVFAAALALATPARAQTPCVGYQRLFWARWAVEVRDDGVYRAGKADTQKPLFVLGEDRVSVVRLIGGADPRPDTHAIATFDPETSTIRTHFGLIVVDGKIDLEAGVVPLGSFRIWLEGRCSPTDALLAAAASNQLRQSGGPVVVP